MKVEIYADGYVNEIKERLEAEPTVKSVEVRKEHVIAVVDVDKLSEVGIDYEDYDDVASYFRELIRQATQNSAFAQTTEIEVGYTIEEVDVENYDAMNNVLPPEYDPMEDAYETYDI